MMFLASFTSQMGSVIGMTAFMFYLLDRFSDKPFLATLTELMYALPMLAVFYLIGVFADRMDRQKIASNCDIISAILSLVFLVTIWIDWLPLIFMILFIRSAMSKFFFPAESALMQGILTKDEYTTAAGLNQMMGSIFMLFGNAIGIFVYWTVGVEGAIMCDIVSFILSAILIRTCRIDREVRLPNGAHKMKDIRFSMILADFKSGIMYILSHKLLLAIIGGFLVFGVVNGAMSVMEVFILKYRLVPETYEFWAVWAGVVFGSGILIGSVVASMIGNKMKLYHMIVLGLSFSGIFIFLSGYAPNITWFLIFSFFMALFLPFINIAIGGWLPSIVDPKMMGRVEGWITPLMLLSQSITLGIIAVAFPLYLSVQTIFAGVGALLMIVAVYYVIILPRYAKQYDELESESPRDGAIAEGKPQTL